MPTSFKIYKQCHSQNKNPVTPNKKIVKRAFLNINAPINNDNILLINKNRLNKKPSLCFSNTVNKLESGEDTNTNKSQGLNSLAYCPAVSHSGPKTKAKI